MIFHSHFSRLWVVALRTPLAFCSTLFSSSWTSLRSRCNSRNCSSRLLGVSKRPRLIEGAICRLFLRFMSLTDAVPDRNKAAERSIIARRLRHAGSGRWAMSGAITLPGPRDGARIVVR